MNVRATIGKTVAGAALGTFFVWGITTYCLAVWGISKLKRTSTRRPQ